MGGVSSLVIMDGFCSRGSQRDGRVPSSVLKLGRRPRTSMRKNAAAGLREKKGLGKGKKKSEKSTATVSHLRTGERTRSRLGEGDPMVEH